MAKATGPLLSVQASGSVAGELTFSKRKSGQQVRFQRKQKDVSSAARTAQREEYSAAVLAWNLLPPTTKVLLAFLNRTAGLTTYNYFIKLFLSGAWPALVPSLHGEREYGVLEFGREI